MAADSERTGPGVARIAQYLPEKTLGNEVIAERLQFEPSFLESKIGITHRHVAAADETTSDMCAKAVARVLAEAGERHDDVDGLIVVTQTPDYSLPQTSALVQHKCGLGKGIAAIDINLGCSGYVYALSVARGWMQSSRFRKLLVVTAERYSTILNPEDRATVPLFGDGATATLVTSEGPRYVIGETTFGTDGKRSEAVIARGSGAVESEPEWLQMDGRAVFSFMMSEVPDDIARCLKANGVSADQVSTWVFHQASRYLVENLARRLELPPERFVLDVADGGNTGSCTIPLALCRQVLDRPRLPEIIGISGFGVGASWASSLLFRRDHERGGD